MKIHHIAASALLEQQSGRLSDSTSAVARGILTAFVALTLWIGSTNPAHAQALSGSGSHLPQGTAPWPLPAVAPAYVDNLNGTFTGTWSSPAQPNWQGAFTLTGSIPAGGGANGSSTYNFTGLTYNILPVNSYFFFSDLDNGSGAENFTFTAYDATHTVISSPWLNTTLGSVGVTFSTDMPGWSWNSGNDTYTFTGGTVPGNPTVAFGLQNNLAIASLDVTRDTSFANFSIAAPESVPEPSTCALLLLGGVPLLARLRRK